MAQKFGTKETNNHDWLMLVPRGSEYVRFVSDIAGYDPKQYDLTPESAIPAVMSWLATRPDAVITPTPKEVVIALPQFITEKNELSKTGGGEAPWADIVLLAMSIGQQLRLISATA